MLSSRRRFKATSCSCTPRVRPTLAFSFPGRRLIGHHSSCIAELRYYDTVTIKHKDTGFYLHSHGENYPLKYDDGRISSQGTSPARLKDCHSELIPSPFTISVPSGQQVTGYPHNDTNNNWVIMPTKVLPETGRGRVARNNDVIQLFHPGTNSYLMTHDVASPLTTTNQEFTTWPLADLATRYNDTTFKIILNEGHEGEPWKTKSGWFKFQHIPTGVNLQIGDMALPDWGYKQQEVNGQRNVNDKKGTWFVEEILMDECESPLLLPSSLHSK